MSKPVALITGGGKRIGAAVSKKLMEMGWYVLIHVNSSVDEARKIISEFSSSNGGVECGDVLTGNLLLDSDVEELISNVINCTLRPYNVQVWCAAFKIGSNHVMWDCFEESFVFTNRRCTFLTL